MTFFKGFSIAMGANITVFALTFLNNKLIYLCLDEQDNGVFFLMMRLTLLFSLFFGDWHRLSALNIAGPDKKTVPVLSANGFWFGLVVGVVLMLLVIEPFAGIAASFAGIPVRYIPVIVVTGALFIMRGTWQSLLLVNHHMLSYGLTFVIWAAAFLVCDVLFLMVMKQGLYHVIIAFVIATVAAAVWAFIVSARLNGHRWKPSPALFSSSLAIGRKAWFALLGMFLMTNVHAFTISSLAPTATAGLAMVAMFSVSYRIFALFQRAADVAGSVLYSHVVQESEKEGYRKTTVVTRNILFVSILFALFIVLFGRPLIYMIASRNYLTAYHSLVLMLPGIVAINAGSVINTHYWGRNFPAKIIWTPYAAALLGGILNVVFMPRWGVAGATLSFSVMSCAWFFCQVVWFTRDTKTPYSEILLPHRADFAFVTERLRTGR